MWLAYPKQICLIYPSCTSVPDFAVSLPSVLLSPTTTLRRANASDITPRTRDFHPLEKYTRYNNGLAKNSCIFAIFQLLCSGCACSCRAHHAPMVTCWLTCNLQSLRPLSLCRFATAKPPATRRLPIALVVSGKCKKK